MPKIYKKNNLYYFTIEASHDENTGKIYLHVKKHKLDATMKFENLLSNL